MHLRPANPEVREPDYTVALVFWTNTAILTAGVPNGASLIVLKKNQSVSRPNKITLHRVAVLQCAVPGRPIACAKQHRHAMQFIYQFHWKLALRLFFLFNKHWRSSVHRNVTVFIIYQLTLRYSYIFNSALL